MSVVVGRTEKVPLCDTGSELLLLGGSVSVVDVGPRPRTYLIVLDVQVRVGAVGHCLPARSLRVFQEGNDTISLVMVSCLLNDRSSRRHGVIDEETTTLLGQHRYGSQERRKEYKNNSIQIDRKSRNTQKKNVNKVYVAT